LKQIVIKKTLVIQLLLHHGLPRFLRSFGVDQAGYQWEVS